MILFGKTDTGRMRKNNEDSFFCTASKLGIFDSFMIVADGMGGLSAGEVASGTCIEAVFNYLKNAPMDNPAHLMQEAVFQANYQVYRESEMRHARSMGTTLCAVGIVGDTAYVINVGDSRLYLLNAPENSIMQVTRDHSYVEEQVRKGLMVRGSAEYNQQKNVITRAIGIYRDVEGDQFEIELSEGDYLLLCSDGLSNMVRDVVIKNLALDDSFDIEKRVDTLINTANNNGGRDNITVILAGYEGEE